MGVPAPRKGAAALVVGASSGIGRELARQLAARGHDVIIVARRRPRLESLERELRERHRGRVEIATCDVSEVTEREALLARIEHLGLEVDIFVMSAGFGMGGAFLSQDPERLQLLVRTNFEATVMLTRALLPAMVRRGSGGVLLVSSVGGNQPMPGFGAYAASKAAVNSFAEMLHAEMAPHGVTVTALCPGGVRTEFSGIAQMDEIERRIPSFMMIDPADCARVGLDGLDQGQRRVVPLRSVRIFYGIAARLPRRLWLALCRRYMVS